MASNCKGCTPNCPYFPPNDGYTEWEYNSEGLKVRKNKKPFICSYDGHQIMDWVTPCPRELDKMSNN